MIFFLEKCCHVLDILLISYVNLIFLIDLNRQFLLAMAMQCINKNMRTTHRIIMDNYKGHFFLRIETHIYRASEGRICVPLDCFTNFQQITNNPQKRQVSIELLSFVYNSRLFVIFNINFKPSFSIFLETHTEQAFFP